MVAERLVAERLVAERPGIVDTAVSSGSYGLSVMYGFGKASFYVSS